MVTIYLTEDGVKKCLNCEFILMLEKHIDRECSWMGDAGINVYTIDSKILNLATQFIGKEFIQEVSSIEDGDEYVHEESTD